MLSFNIIEADKTTQLPESDNTGLKMEIYRFTSTKYAEFRYRPHAASLRSVLDCNPWVGIAISHKFRSWIAIQHESQTCRIRPDGEPQF